MQAEGCGQRDTGSVPRAWWGESGGCPGKGWARRGSDAVLLPVPAGAHPGSPPQVASESVGSESVGSVLVSDAGPWHRGSAGLGCGSGAAECWQGKGVCGVQGGFCPLPVPRCGPTHAVTEPYAPSCLCQLPCSGAVIGKAIAEQVPRAVAPALPMPWGQGTVLYRVPNTQRWRSLPGDPLGSWQGPAPVGAALMPLSTAGILFPGAAGKPPKPGKEQGGLRPEGPEGWPPSLSPPLSPHSPPSPGLSHPAGFGVGGLQPGECRGLGLGWVHVTYRATLIPSCCPHPAAVPRWARQGWGEHPGARRVPWWGHGLLE